MRGFRISMVGTVLICLLPIMAVLLSTATASLGGCKLDEASVHPCVIAGVDIGGTLGALFIMGWLGVMTLPLLGMAVLVWAAVELGRVFIARLNRK